MKNGIFEKFPTAHFFETGMRRKESQNNVDELHVKKMGHGIMLRFFSDRFLYK